MIKLLLIFLILVLSQTVCADTTITDVVLTDVEVNSNPMVQAVGSRFYKDGEPFYFVGVNCYRLPRELYLDQVNETTTVEDYFDEWQNDGVKVVRIQLAILGDLALDDPTSAPTATAISGGTLTDGTTYIYRYAARNRSANNIDYTWATTLCSPIVSVAITAPNQSVQLTLPYVENAYSYRIYRRESTDAADSEELIKTAYVQTGLDYTWIDDGSETPSGAIPGSNTTQDYPKLDWYGEPFMLNPTTPNEDQLVLLDNILELARQHDVMIMPHLIDWQDNLTGGVKAFCDYSGLGTGEGTGQNTGTNKNAFWDSCLVEEWIEGWISTLMNRTNTVNNRLYKNDPAIFGWDLMNEPWGGYSGVTMRRWIRKTIDHIKSIDKNHLIGIGITGEIWWRHTGYSSDIAPHFYNGWNRGLSHSYIGENSIEGIDFCNWHGYPESAYTFDKYGYGHWTAGDPVISTAEDPLTIAEFRDEMLKRANFCFIDKPIIISEISPADWDIPGTWILDLSQAVLDIKPTKQLGDNLLLNPDFQDGLTDWTFDASCSIDTDITYKQRQTLNCEDISDSNIISQIITIQPNTDYWVKMIYKKPDTDGLVRLYIEGRVDPGDAWTTADYLDCLEETTYWQNHDFVERGYFRISSASYTQFRIRMYSWGTINDFWIAYVECKPIEGRGGDTAFGGILWFSYGTTMQTSAVRQQLRDAAALY